MVLWEGCEAGASLRDHTPPIWMAPHRAGRSAQSPSALHTDGFLSPIQCQQLEKRPGSSLGTVLLPPVPCPTAASGSTASRGVVYTSLPLPQGTATAPALLLCSTNCDKLWFHWTPPCFLTPLWHFISGETEALHYRKAPCLLTLHGAGSFSIQAHTALPVLSSWRTRVEEEALTGKPHKYLLPCPPRAIIWGFPQSCAQLK